MMNIKIISILLISFVILTVGGYATFLIIDTWPITEHSINKAGVFGDSFGIITSLFSGLAFSGMIITILLQKEELRLQRKELTDNRKEFKKSANAQERNAQLSALTALLSEYKSQISKNDTTILKIEKDSLEEFLNPNMKDAEKTPLIEENIDFVRRKKVIITKIEKILQETGIKLEKM